MLDSQELEIIKANAKSLMDELHAMLAREEIKNIGVDADKVVE